MQIAISIILNTISKNRFIVVRETIIYKCIKANLARIMEQNGQE